MNSTTGQELHNPGADQAPDGPDMDVPWYKKKFYRAVGGVAALLLAGGAVVGVANANKGDGDSDPNPVATASAPETPGETTEPSPEPTQEPEVRTPAEVIASINVNEYPSSIIELGTFELLPPENQARMHELDNMDAVTFRAQPYEGEQVPFLMQILDNERPLVDHQLAINGITDLHYTDNPTTAQQIADNITYIEITAGRLITRDATDNYVYDTLLAQKMLSLINDIRVEPEDQWDELYGPITIPTLWSFPSLDEHFGLTVTSESLAPDGTQSFDASNALGDSISMQVSSVAYTSMIDNSAQQLQVVINSQQH